MRISFILLLISLQVWCQNAIKYSSPLDIPIYPSGTFGELRGNHFHSGLDIRTQQKVGFPVYAPADGWVSRIKVSTYGYGKALYIDHPDGKTTVYGHLNAYSGAIAEFVKKRHYSEKKIEIEMFPQKGQLTVKKGDIIAYTGNSGGSGGPHLHYEFRNTRTQHIINPFLVGMDEKVKDTKAPTVNAVTVYAVGKNAAANAAEIPSQLSYTTKGGMLVTEKVKAKGTIGFGVDAYDTSDNNYGKNGLYKVEAFLNGKSKFAYQFDEFSFAESRYVNALIDYGVYDTKKQRVQKLFYEKKYPLSVLQSDSDQGLINVNPGENYNYKIVLSDFHGNTTEILIPIEYSKDEAKIKKTPPNESAYLIKSDREHVLKRGRVEVILPTGAFYNDFYLDFEVKNQVLTLHNTTVPIHKNITVNFDVSSIEGLNREKAFIGRKTAHRNEYFSTWKKGNLFSIKTRDFGEYKIMEDTEAPVIYKPSFSEGQWISTHEAIAFFIKDDLSGISEINGYINGRWALFDYDYKTHKIQHFFSDGVVQSGRNEVKIVAKDRIGNESVFETHFFIKI